MFRRTYGTLDGPAQPLQLPRNTTALPKEPPAEVTAERSDFNRNTPPGRAVPAPHFARLQHLDDGRTSSDTSVLRQEQKGKEPAIDLYGSEMQNEAVHEEERREQAKRKNRNSTEPDFNPW